jgi:3D (Asp-Asp-Asp) domain-containing protein
MIFCSIYFATAFCLNIITCPIYEYKKAIFTAYTLSEDETDKTPCIGAGNHNLCELQKRKKRICASRTIPLHTIIKINGVGNCEIMDRISVKYSNRIDILVRTKKEAFAFGKQELEYRIIK